MNTPGKNFRKRGAILEYLRLAQDHPSAEMIYADLKNQIPDLSMGTVYRNLKLFQQQGCAACIATVSGVERFDGCTRPHVHFVCSSCRSVVDVPEMPIPQLSTPVGRVDSCQLCYTGICQTCLSNS